jgi:hypothetical protein
MTEIVLRTDTTFPQSYECEKLPEIPGTTTLVHYYYPGVTAHGGRDGVLVEVRPGGGQPWLGTFAFGYLTGVSGIFATPDPHRLCVVSAGDGYLVSVNEPTAWEMIKAIPIIDVRPVRARDIIVFANFTELVAYGKSGIKWRTERLTWDGMKITEVTDSFIKAEYWDVRSEAMASFVVDLATGRQEGGVGDI